MLVLSRRPGESIIIGDNVEVKVLAWKDGQVSLGITAPIGLSVHRREVYETVLAENLAAVRQGRVDLSSLPKPR
ncbi:MAG TPA: carbon storage regulator CsrA [bacterium]|jgi:carbon storage regulator|nr:carbon storage regulator CsrA [bacterium]